MRTMGAFNAGIDVLACRRDAALGHPLLGSVSLCQSQTRIAALALGHCVRQSPETGDPSDRNCSRASLRSDVVSVYYLQRSAISA